MRFIIALSALMVLGAGAISYAHAAPVQAGDFAVKNSAIVPAAQGCGAGMKWAKGHWNAAGVWIPGHCRPK